MGRVYDALKRAGATDRGSSKRKFPKRSDDGEFREAIRFGRDDAESNGETASERSRLFAVTGLPYDSAPNAHTDASSGSALPGGLASRDAGATLGAGGSTRAMEFVALEISPARVEPHLVALTQPHSAHSEVFRSLRTRVLHAGERNRSQAFVITSAGIAEGKTLTALNLAWLLAQTDGVRALVIDADLRHPCSASYLGIEPSAGLSEVLAGEVALADAIIRLEPSGLHLLPGGSQRENVAEILSGPTFLAVLAQLRTMFDYIIIDAPPLGIFTDAAVLIDRADSAILVVRSGKTRYAAVDRLLESLPRNRILGVVLNRAEDEYTADSYYEYYYRQGEESADTPVDEKAREVSTV